MADGVVLAVNAGSSSVKLAAYDPADLRAAVWRDSLQVSGDPASCASETSACIAARLRPAELVASGHRIVMSARRPAVERIDEPLLAIFRGAASRDPEHLPLQVAIADALARWAPGAAAFACQDSAFHANMPAVARTLPLPASLREAGCERFGFHGLSCAFLVDELARLGGAAYARGRVILAHLGHGASITAVLDGQSVDTSMGYSPSGGLVMATRSGDIDPGIVRALTDAQRLDVAAFSRLTSHEAGLLAVSGSTGDLAELLRRTLVDRHASEAIELFCYQARKFVGAYASILGGIDVLAFSGGVGQHLPEIRARICDGLAFLGVTIDPAANAANRPVISMPGAAATVRVIATDEELMIARLVVAATAARAG